MEDKELVIEQIKKTKNIPLALIGLEPMTHDDSRQFVKYIENRSCDTRKYIAIDSIKPISRVFNLKKIRDDWED
ncbi:MAG: hypothetical protein GQ574_08725 [Crocinitomix sp.]|nr:hypothetical protein [Crocinitomix sp.]